MVTSVFYPKQLSSEEEEALVVRCQKGDAQARNILIEHNLRLVAHIAKKYSSTGYPTDDLISIGSIGLIKAVSTYNPEKGTKLGTYAVRCIANATLSQMSFWLRKELPIGELPNRLRKICI